MYIEKLKKILSRKRSVYLDYVAATPMSTEVERAMRPYWRVKYGNPGSIHTPGLSAHNAVETARAEIAANMCAQPDEIIFTGSGTEANNLAIFGTAKYMLENKKCLYSDMHFITSSIEHPSVLGCFKELKRLGASVTFLPVDEEGRINPEDVDRALTERTVLVSCMYVNNEIGTIEPVAEVAKMIRIFKKNRQQNEYPYFHIDASQAAPLLPLDVRKLHVDLMAIDAQKMYGPKGIGALFKKRGVEISPILYGGSQEFGIRPGTENVPLIVGFAKAYKGVVGDYEKELKRLRALQDHFIELLSQYLPRAELNGAHIDRIPNNVNISIPSIDSEYMVILLDAHGISCGTRSACIKEEGGASEVITALGKSKALAASSLRFSLGKYTTSRDIRYVVKTLKKLIVNFDTRDNT